MKIDRMVIILGAAPFAAILVALIVASRVNFDYKPAAIEAEITSVSVGDIKIKEREPFYAKNITSPIQISKTAKKGFPDTALATVAPQPKSDEPELKISMILINNFKKMAIINGIVLSEGDMIGKDKVLKIEKERVSIRSFKGEKWIKLSQ
ncbi:MAG: hypothetical protein LLF86_05180 [Nitrospiraceae bacterium]|nr:hypothetical protein [Nitrospiraceae bacterium]